MVKRVGGEAGGTPNARRGAGSALVRTSILRPSTMVPFSFSRARSASALVSKVTNPKPCE